jgi:hypothetical protein
MTMNETSNLTTINIEHIIKQFKIHRCTLNFDSAFIKSVIVQRDEQ